MKKILFAVSFISSFIASSYAAVEYTSSQEADTFVMTVSTQDTIENVNRYAQDLSVSSLRECQDALDKFKADLSARPEIIVLTTASCDLSAMYETAGVFSGSIKYMKKGCAL